MRKSHLLIRFLLCAAGLFLLCLIGGSHAPLPDSSVSTAAAKVYSGKVLTHDTTVDGIPLTEFYRDDGTKKPLILLQHGLQQDKSVMRPAAKLLAQAGYFVVTPDAYAHGARQDPPSTLYEIIRRTSADYDTLLTYYRQWQPQANTDRFGVAGFSLGGMIAYYYAAYGQAHPTMMAALCALPDWEDLVGDARNHVLYARGKTYPMTSEAEEKQADEQAYLHSPMLASAHMRGIQIYQQLGDEDPIFNVSHAYALRDKDPSLSLTIDILPHQGHEFTNESARRAVIWLFLHFAP